MSNETILTSSKPKEGAVSFADFLESAPPNQVREITKIFGSSQGATRYCVTPEIQLHCPSERCNGVRVFRASSSAPYLSTEGYRNSYLKYTCSNCQNFSKTFSLSLLENSLDDGGSALKYGEFPPFGPPTPSKLISLVGPDRDAFLKGRRCENQGLGIGAFIYYRRVVENQKARIITQIADVAERLQAPEDSISHLRAAAKEDQFSRALDMAKPYIPPNLLIDGHNPLGLLHSALSDGVHAQTDEHCLALASSVRVVLSELSERMSQLLKDEADLKHALSTILQVAASNKTHT